MTTLTTDDPESLLLRALHITQLAQINRLTALNMRYYAALQRLAVVRRGGITSCMLCHRSSLDGVLTHCAQCLLVTPPV